MKPLRLPVILIVIPLLMLVWSFEPVDQNASAYTPVLMKRTDLPASVFFQQEREFINPGKIYLYGNFIFIADLFKGIHVIDNSDPENPWKTGFIHIPGVMDLAIKDHVLFADNSIDLISVDISAYPQITVLNRVEDVFPEATPPDLDWIPWQFSKENRPPNTVIVAWERK